MNTQANANAAVIANTNSAATFKTASTGTRIFSAALGGVCSIGMLFAVVGGMMGHSGGQPLGDFVASQLLEHGAVHVAATAAGNGSTV